MGPPSIPDSDRSRPVGSLFVDPDDGQPRVDLGKTAGRADALPPQGHGDDAPAGHRSRFIDAFRVDLVIWFRASLVMLALGAVLMLASVLGKESVAGSTEVVALLIGAIASGWGVAVGFAHLEARKREESGTLPSAVGGFVSFLVVFPVLFPTLRWLSGHVDASMFWWGAMERIVLFPVVMAFLLAVFVGVGLHRGVSAFGAVIIAMILFSTDASSSDDLNERISTASAAQLQYAARTGEPVLIRGIDHAPGVRVDGYGPTEATATCESVEFATATTTLFGMWANRRAVDVDACWSKGGRPVSVTVAARRAKLNAVGTAYEVRLLPSSPFAAEPDPERTVSFDRGPSQSLRYGDDRADISTEPLRHEASPLVIRDATGLIRDDGNPRNDSGIARVNEAGDEITVVVAVEAADGFLARPGSRERRNRSYDRQAGAAPEAGRSLDVITAVMRRGGKSETTHRRTTAGNG